MPAERQAFGIARARQRFGAIVHARADRSQSCLHGRGRDHVSGRIKFFCFLTAPAWNDIGVTLLHLPTFAVAPGEPLLLPAASF
jgi:hypothetical protein